MHNYILLVLLLKVFLLVLLSKDEDSVLEAYYRNNSDATAPVDIALTKIDRSTYSQTPNKLAKGTPSQYYVERKINPSIFLYTTPSSSVSSTTTPSNFQFCFYYLAKIQDAGSYNLHQM